MKKTIFAAVAVLMLSVTANNLQAQNIPGVSSTTPQRTTFGIRAGVNFTNINGKDISGNNSSNKLKTGFNAGINAEIPLAPSFYFQPGLLYSTKGARSFENDFGVASNTDLTLNYLEVPLNLLFKAGFGPTGNVLLGFGPYVAYGVGGKLNSSIADVDVKFKKDADLSDNDAVYFKPWDAGLNLLVGYEFNPKLSLQLNAQLGVTDINAYNTDAKYRNTGYGLSVGYRF